MNVAFSNIGNPIQLNSASTCLVNSSLKEKLHFTTLNYVLNYTLHLKLLECTVITLTTVRVTLCSLHPLSILLLS